MRPAIEAGLTHLPEAAKTYMRQLLARSTIVSFKSIHRTDT